MNPLVSADWLAENLDDPQLVILDASIKTKLVKTPPISTTLRIPGARFFDLKGAFSDKESNLPNTLPSTEAFTAGVRELGINQDSKIVVYDNFGVYSSPRVWWMFKAMGHAEVAVLDGGLKAWVENEYICEWIEDQNINPGNFEGKLQPSLMKDATYIKEHLDDNNIAIIDARSEGRFKGMAPEPRAGLKGGHIPNSLNLPWAQVIKDGQFLSKEELKTLFDSFNINDKTLVFTCGSGLSACIILLASELISGQPKAIYDGSWSEWGQESKDYPVHQ